jgi:UDP-glucose 4-epimerase
MSNGKPENLKEFKDHPGFSLRIADVNDKYWEMPKTDVIFHLAAKADIVPSIKNPLDYHETNVNGTLSMLEHAKRTGARFIYAASSSCYGDNPRIPSAEWDECDPQYPYALTKYVGEQYALHWAKVYKIPVISLRLFNVYGPRHRTSGAYGAMFGVFLSQLANDKPLTIVGDGSQKRDFTYISDVVDAFVLAMKLPRSSKGRVFNIGSGKPTSVKEIGQLLGAERAVSIPKRPGEPKNIAADIESARAFLKYQPKVSIEEGCKIMKSLIPEYRDAPLWNETSIKEATKEWFEALA